MGRNRGWAKPSEKWPGRYAHHPERIALRYGFLGYARRCAFILAVHGLRPGAHCRDRDERVGHRSKADDPEHGFRQFRWSEKPCPDYGLHPACCQERKWKIVVLASRRSQRRRSASPALQQTSAAGADRASYRGPQNLLGEFVQRCIVLAPEDRKSVV